MDEPTVGSTAPPVMAATSRATPTVMTVATSHGGVNATPPAEPFEFFGLDLDVTLRHFDGGIEIAFRLMAHREAGEGIATTRRVDDLDIMGG